MITQEGSKAFAELKLKTQAKTLDLVVQGWPQVEIAHCLGISPETVKQHLQRARRILKATNTVVLAAGIVQRNWVKVDKLGGRDGQTNGSNSNYVNRFGKCTSPTEDLNRLLEPFNLSILQ